MVDEAAHDIFPCGCASPRAQRGKRADAILVGDLVASLGRFLKPQKTKPFANQLT